MLGVVWNFVFGWAGIDIIVGFGAVAVAALEPPIVAAIIPDLRKWAIATAVVAFTFTGLIAHGYKNGLAVKQAEWDAALAKEAVKGEKAHADAEHTVGPVSPDRGVFHDDRFNRNHGKQSGSK